MKIAVPTAATAGHHDRDAADDDRQHPDGHQRLPAPRQARADFRVHRRSSDLHGRNPKRPADATLRTPKLGSPDSNRDGWHQKPVAYALADSPRKRGFEPSSRTAC